MNISEILEALKQPTSSLPVGERLFAGFSIAILAMVVVFCLLVLIALIINILQREKPAPQKVEEVKVVQTTLEEAVEYEETDDTELVAVITAAIVASTGKSNIVVTKIRRTNNVIGSWGSLSKNTVK